MGNPIYDYLLIKNSDYFDPAYYLMNYADVRHADVDPLMHFVKTGWKEGRNPSADFDINKYLLDFPELLSNNVNPLEVRPKTDLFKMESARYFPNSQFKR